MYLLDYITMVDLPLETGGGGKKWERRPARMFEMVEKQLPTVATGAHYELQLKEQESTETTE